MPSFSNKLLDIKCMKANCWLLNVILNFVNKARLLATNLEQYSNARYNFDTVLNHLEHELLLYGNWIHFSAFFRYNKKEKSKELVVIQKGIRLPQPEMASQQPLLPAGIRPASLPRVKFPQPFAHSLPENTAGKTNVRGNPTAPRPRIYRCKLHRYQYLSTWYYSCLQRYQREPAPFLRHKKYPGVHITTSNVSRNKNLPARKRENT